jgi:lipoprotein-releasing system ATP-binding protein
MKTPLLKAADIRKSFHIPHEVPILKGVSLEVYPGDTVAITGKSGQGKSTLLQILGTLDPPCSGYLEIASKPVSIYTKNELRNRHIAFIFQSFHLLEDYTALENILMPVRIGRQNAREGSPMHKRAWMLLEQMHISHRAHFPVKYLSGGEKQRVAIARAFIHNPDIIFADEPSGNLDKENAQLTHDLLIDFATKQHKALLVVTHDPLLAAMCQTNYEICDGLLRQCAH